MKRLRARKQDHDQRPIRPGVLAYFPLIAIAFVCILCTIVAHQTLLRHAQSEADQSLELAGLEIKAEIQSEFERYEHLLLLAKRFYESSDSMNRDRWAWFAHGLERDPSNPDIVGLAFIAKVDQEDSEAFVQRQRADGMHGFRIFEPDHHDNKGHQGPRFVINYHEPAARNREVWGLNLASHSKNREVYDEALLRNTAQLSSAIQLHQAAFQSNVGAVMCIPVFDIDLSQHGTPNRGEHTGWVAVAINTKPTFESSWKPRWNGLNIEVYANRENAEPSLWYRRMSETSKASEVFETRQLQFDSYGNQMSVRWTPASAHWGKPNTVPANTALGVGSVITLLVTAVSLSVLRTRSRAVRLARSMTDSLRESERKQRELASNAERANLAKSDFLANMSHEIRTPMTAILGYSDILRQRVKDPSDRESIGAIRRSGEHLLLIINDVLDLSKIEAGHFAIEKSSVELASAVDDVLSGFRPTADQRGVDLILKLDGTVPTHIHSDPVRIRQILTNLVGNAIKFTERGSITLTLSHREDRLTLEVADTGIGIEPEHLSRIFQPFEQADNSNTRQHEGTGLGLAISNKIASLLGGEIKVTSEPGVGSTFKASLLAPPTLDANWTNVLGVLVETPRSESNSAMLSGRVLLAEDGIDNQRLISYFLRQAGLEVDVVENGREALERLQRTNEYDLLVTDMQMPVMDGYTMTACLREMGNTIPILALTAHAMSGDRERCLAVGCDAYEPKPINQESLIASIEKLFESKRPAQPNEASNAA